MNAQRLQPERNIIGVSPNELKLEADKADVVCLLRYYYPLTPLFTVEQVARFVINLSFYVSSIVVESLTESISIVAEIVVYTLVEYFT
jgi:hypothetical protein